MAAIFSCYQFFYQFGRSRRHWQRRRPADRGIACAFAPSCAPLPSSPRRPGCLVAPIQSVPCPEGHKRNFLAPGRPDRLLYLRRYHIWRGWYAIVQDAHEAAKVRGCNAVPPFGFDLVEDLACPAWKLWFGCARGLEPLKNRIRQSRWSE